MVRYDSLDAVRNGFRPTTPSWRRDPQPFGARMLCGGGVDALGAAWSTAPAVEDALVAVPGARDPVVEAAVVATVFEGVEREGARAREGLPCQ
ncbi:hypothetical protein Stube_69000 [Streptomyces tubercidicus]|uniref:Uncharacterized protein n=1 Tax=Streptomyces tubercidicus TaxID=47759 RepID=A0A640V3F9_9ACTN|nr:hypothetical protein Stube_69000 [Streptomyces tubercidicus]